MREKKHNFSFVISSIVPQCIVTDKHKFLQILINLVSNSIKFTQVGGTIKVVIDAKYSELNIDVIITSQSVRFREV